MSWHSVLWRMLIGALGETSTYERNPFMLCVHNHYGIPKCDTQAQTDIKIERETGREGEGKRATERGREGERESNIMVRACNIRDPCMC